MTKLLGRKRLPSQALAFAATVIADSRYEVARAANDGHDMAATLLNLDGQRHYGQPNPIAAMTQATPTKAGHALLAVALGALEAATDKNSWRNPDQVTRQYLDQLAAWGYTLSDVETLITDPDSVTRTEDTPEDDTASENIAAEETSDEETDTAADGENGTDEDDATDVEGAEDATALENPADAEESLTETDDADATEASGTDEDNATDAEVADAA